MTTRLRIDGFAHGGRGVGRLDGKVVFVAGALPGELVEASITLDRKRWAEAEVVEVIEPADGRVDPPCRWVPDCGGCDQQHAAPTLQRELKTRVVREQLERLGGQEHPPVADCRAVGPDVGYRNNVQLHADGDGRLGFHRARSHEVVPIDRCLVASESINNVLTRLPDAGGAEEIGIRAHGSDRALVVQPGPGPLRTPDVEAQVHLVQPDGSTAPLRGDGILRERVHDIDFAFGPSDFFQVNSGGAAAIVAEVLAVVGDVSGQLTWDLYAGVGLLSIPLARAGAEVTAVESSLSAATFADGNAVGAGVDLAVVCEDVPGWLERSERDDDPSDVVVLDPPRDGAGRAVCERLAALDVPLVVYVACDPASLARDVATLTGLGYRLRSAQPLDLFPMTHHVEVVATLVR